jgi:hypothetical protein
MFSQGKGPSVPRHLRNPRRAYDAEGREMTPATVANSQQNGARGIIAVITHPLVEACFPA